MEDINLIEHTRGAPCLRLLGLGPMLIPVNAIHQLQKLLEENTFWAKGRSKKQLKKMIANSSTIVTLWKSRQLIGFGRATSDETFRAVLWDVVISNRHQKHGLGKKLIRKLLTSKAIINTECVYLMTTNCKDFYIENNFIPQVSQDLLILKNKVKKY